MNRITLQAGRLIFEADPETSYELTPFEVLQIVNIAAGLGVYQRPPSAQELGVLLKAAREELGMTQVRLAHRLDVSVGYLSKMENGTANITNALWHKVVNVLSEAFISRQDEGEVLT